MNEPPRDCEPRWATPRTADRPTLGAQAAKVAAVLGTPLMPWQRRIADVAFELHPDTGLFVYRNVTVTVPRQCGKTTLILVLFLMRGLATAKQNMLYAAQGRSSGKEKLVDDWLPVLEESRFNKYYDVRLTNGSEGLSFTNKSRLGLLANTLKSGHGKVVDLGVVDEAFSLPDGRMEQAMRPAMKTREQPQFWLTSTAGTPTMSPYLYTKVKQGRQNVDDGITDDSAYFEWSATDDQDPGDPETWWSCTPALGYTIQPEAIRSDYMSMDISEFCRADLNRWMAAPVASVIDLDLWDRLVDDNWNPGDRQVAIAFDIMPDRSSASVAAAVKTEDDNWFVAVIRTAPGTSWLPQFLADIWHKRRPVGIWLDRNGPAGSMISDLQNLNVPLVNDVPVSDLAKACGQFYDACVGRDEEGNPIPSNLRHRSDETLRVAIDGAVKRPVSDSWVWDRKHSGVDISPLVAVTMALYGAKQFSRAPQVWSIQDVINERKNKQTEALDAIVDDVTNEPEDDTPQESDFEPDTIAWNPQLHKF